VKTGHSATGVRWMNLFSHRRLNDRGKRGNPLMDAWMMAMDDGYGRDVQDCRQVDIHNNNNNNNNRYSYSFTSKLASLIIINEIKIQYYKL